MDAEIVLAGLGGCKAILVVKPRAMRAFLSAFRVCARHFPDDAGIVFLAAVDGHLGRGAVDLAIRRGFIVGRADAVAAFVAVCGAGVPVFAGRANVVAIDRSAGSGCLVAGA